MSRFSIRKPPEAETEEKDIPPFHLVGIQLGSEEYVVDITTVREIIMLDGITYVPRVPEHIEGVINLRGEVVPVINLRVKLGMEDTDFTPRTRIIIAEIGQATAGFLVDAITRVFKLPKINMEATASGVGEVSAEFLRGVGRTEDNIVGWLDLDKLVA